MLLVDDVAATAARYEHQGFRRLASDEPECVGLVADRTGTGLMLLGRTYAAQSMPAAAVGELEKGAGLYVWVDRLADVTSTGMVLGEVETHYGVRERCVRDPGGLFVYAERLVS
jgi:hypothetical protein